MTAARRKLPALALCCVLAAACAQLPDTELLMRDAHPGAVRLDGPDGPLSKERSAAILARIEAKSGSADVLEKHVALEEAIAGSPLVVGNKVTLLEDGPATYRAMFAAIRKARDHVNLESYILDDDETGRQFADLLLAKRGEGVQVNLIYDGVGGLRTSREFFQRLKEGGIHVLEFNPVNPLKARKGWQINHRDHRKLLVVDGTVAFVGGINISDVYSTGSAAARHGSDPAAGGWRDTHVEIEGPVVANFQKLFMETWTSQAGEALSGRNYFPPLAAAGSIIVRAIGGSAEDPYSAIYVTLVSAITCAEKNVYLTNAYFVPDPQLLEALIAAARRGVDVKVILPSESDSALVLSAGRSYYAELLEAGVRIFERQGVLLHSKTATIDGVWSTIGSTNLDWRSFLHNDELNAVILGREFAGQMEGLFGRDLAASRAVDAAGWARRSPLERLREWAARLWQYWL
jgi:cardiolipin synthase A/B